MQLIRLKEKQHALTNIVHLLIDDNMPLAAMDVHNFTALMPVVITLVMVVCVQIIIPHERLLILKKHRFEQLLHKPSAMTKYKHLYSVKL
ncbi:hypothetical protein D3C85_1605610 [compost metagenome]